MHNCLYMICPCDNIEPVIHNRFNGQKYFYTSLGNSISLEEGTLKQIAAIVKTNSIRQITFVLADDNRIVIDALNNQEFIKVRGLSKAYNHLLEHKKNSLNYWINQNQNGMILSYHLNQKIEELKLSLYHHLPNPPEISGILFSRAYNSFKQIHNDLLCINSIKLN